MSICAIGRNDPGSSVATADDAAAPAVEAGDAARAVEAAAAARAASRMRSCSSVESVGDDDDAAADAPPRCSFSRFSDSIARFAVASACF